MIQLRVGESGSATPVTFLDLYENDPPKLTLSIEDIFDTQATSNYSQNFRVPATENNYQFFQSAFEINGLDFDITQKKNAQVLVDGAEFSVGFIRLQKIHKNNIDNKVDYEIVFFGETKSFGTTIGNKLINDLDFSEYNSTITYNDITGSWLAYPQGGITDGFFDGDIIFPLVDFGNTYEGDVLQDTRMGVGTTDYFTDSSYPLHYSRFKPMIRAKAVWDKIWSGSGFTYESNFIDSDLFKQMYISAWGSEAKNTMELSSGNTFLTNDVDTSYKNKLSNPTYLVNFLSEVSDPGDNFDLITYTVPVNGNYEIAVSANAIVNKVGLASGFTVVHSLVKNVGGFETELDSLTQTLSNSTEVSSNFYQKFFSLQYNGPLTAGDIIYIKVNQNTATVVGSYYDGCIFTVNSAPGEFTLQANLNNKHKQIDFIKDILTKFRLVLARDRNNSNKFIIEPWENYIGTGQLFDWTNKLDLSKDITIEPVFFNQKAKITFNDKEDKDVYNELNNSQFGEVFGTLEVNVDNDLLKDEREIKTTFSPTPVSQIRNATSTIAEDFIIPHIYTTEVGDVVKYKPIIPNPRLLFYNGLVVGGDVYYIEDEGSVTRTRTSFPMVSHLSEYPYNGTMLDLNWQRETGYDQFDPPSIYLGNSVYDIYWRNYINLLYNPFARRLTAHFILSADDLFTFSFDDVIFVKDTYFYVEKIENIELGQKQSVKVSLIKLIDYRPDTANFIPLGDNWEDINVNWESITDLWETL